MNDKSHFKTPSHRYNQSGSLKYVSQDEPVDGNRDESVDGNLFEKPYEEDDDDSKYK